MIVEEAKAPDRICPQMISQTPEYRWCQGSRCMAWRWANDEGTDATTKWPYVKLSTTHGYCGLAGRP